MIKHNEIESGRSDNAIIEKDQTLRLLQNSLNIELLSGPTDVRIFEMIEKVSKVKYFSHSAWKLSMEIT